MTQTELEKLRQKYNKLAKDKIKLEERVRELEAQLSSLQEQFKKSKTN